jgi:Zn-dependent protease with chaperone function
MLVFDHLNHAVLVGPNQLPSLYKSLLKASKILNMDAPDLYVQHNTIPNANTLAYQGAKPFILLNTGLLDLLDNHEIEAVIAHELGHLKCNHGPWLSLLNLINIFAATPAGFLLQPMKPWLDKWRYAAEFSCDRASLLVAKDFNVVASTIMKLCGGSAKSRFQKELNVEAFLQQPLRLKESFSSVANFPLIQGISTQSRPLPFERLHQLRQWSSSKQFVDLLTLIS